MKVFLSFPAKAQLLKLSAINQDRIESKLLFFAAQLDPLAFSKHLDSKLYRFRVGDYRIKFKIKEGAIHVAVIERRDKAYD